MNGTIDLSTSAGRERAEQLLIKLQRMGHHGLAEALERRLAEARPVERAESPQSLRLAA